MRVVTIKHLRRFQANHPDVANALHSWMQEARKGRWRSPQDIRDRFANAGFIAGNRVVFNLKGNDYRLVVAVAYRFQVVYLKFIGTHAEYDRIDARTIEMD